jgi:hypothetical protein
MSEAYVLTSYSDNQINVLKLVMQQMIRANIIIFLSTLFSHSLFAQWELISDPVGSDHYYVDVQFLNQDTGYVVGRAHTLGAVLRTYDGGGNWDTIYVNDLPNTLLGTFTPTKVSFPTDSIGYLLSQTDIARTTDGGTTWTVVDTGNVYIESGPSKDLFFMNNDTGFIGWADGGASCLVTHDGGLSWNQDPNLLGVRNFNKYGDEVVACAEAWADFDETTMTWQYFDPISY